MPLAAAMRSMPFSCRPTIWRISCSVSGVNMMISSMRLRNSGRMVFFSRSSTSAFVSATTRSRFSSVSFSKLSRMSDEPMLLVIMMIVFLKFTVRPLLSVRRPSSSTCSSTLKTSGCAFSISSKRTTE